MPLPATYHILVLDDDPVLRDLTATFLSTAGHGVTAFASSGAALAQLHAHSDFDVILTDLNMPGLEGAALVVALRAAIPASVPLVGMSASQPPANTQALFDAFLLKPFHPQTLLETIGNAIRSQAGPPAAPPPQAPQDSQDSKPVLDETILESLARAIPPPQLRKLYEMGIADVEKRLIRIQEAAETGDMATIKREAHTMKGSCGMVGARELEALAFAIEESTTFDAPAMAQIPHACLRLRRVLDAKLQVV